MDELERVVERVKAAGAAPEDAQVLSDVVASYAYMTELIRDKQTSSARLRKPLSGPTSERKHKALGKAPAEAPTPTPVPEVEGSSTQTPPPAAAPDGDVRAKGHGRNGAQAYPGATKVAVPHESLHAGGPCPNCRGKVYGKEPRRLVRIRAAAPFLAMVFEQEQLRCNLCGEVFPAKLPAGVGEEKYDATVTSMLAVLRYGSGLPLNRIAALQDSSGIPMPVSTQWDLVSKAAEKLVPAYEELLRAAAQGELIHNDDTPMVILAYLKEERERRERGEDPSERTGIFTTGIVAIAGGRRIVLYATGRQHAGENLTELLRRRETDREPPMQMCDGLERNVPAELKTIVSNCVVHARRQFVDVVAGFPDEVRYVLEELAIVYRTEARAKAEGLSPAARLRLHQQESGPVMERLSTWFSEVIAEKKVEPNSGLGKAIAYAQKRWSRLTLFLRVEGAALDNNICEAVLKRAILHRKNSLFYKTQNGARVGDLYMSLIATAKLAKADPFDYLTELQRHASEVAKSPSAWLPWNYRETLADRVRPATAPPAPPDEAAPSESAPPPA